MNQLAILVDGDYMKTRMVMRLKRFPTAEDLVEEFDRIYLTVKELPYRTAPLQLYRVFYYTADPFTGVRQNPFDGQTVNFSSTDSAQRNRKLIGMIERQNHVAVRRGEMAFRGWRFKRNVIRRLERRTGTGKRTVNASDIEGNFVQKGVDMRIGLDIATLALKRLVTDVAVVTGDLDMVPAFKLARREGLRVYLDRMGTGGREALCVHSDLVIG